MKFNFLSNIFLVSGVVIMGYSCEKVDVPDELGDAGTTIVKIPSTKKTTVAIVEANPAPQAINLVEVRRDVVSQSDLNKSMTVVLETNFSIVQNIKPTGISEPPVGSFNFDAVNPNNAGQVSLTFAPGEFAKSIKINIPDGSVFDASKQYGIGFVVKSVDQGAKKSALQDSVAVLITIKSQYEGKYAVTGYFQHPSVPRAIDQVEILPTVNGNTVQKTLGDLTGTNIYLSVDASNNVTVTPGPGTSGTTAAVAIMTGDNTYNNTYDPATKTFWLKYGYPMPSPTRIITEKIVRQ